MPAIDEPDAAGLATRAARSPSRVREDWRPHRYLSERASGLRQERVASTPVALPANLFAAS